MRYLRQKKGDLIECKVDLINEIIEIGNNFYLFRELENLGFELVPEKEKRWLWIFEQKWGKRLTRTDGLWMTRTEAESHAAEGEYSLLGREYSLLGRDENVKISIDDMYFKWGVKK